MAEHSEHRSRVLDIVASLEFWLIIAYIVLALVVVWLFVFSAERHRDEAIHKGEVIADARAKVNACLRSRPQLRKTDAVLTAILDFHQVVYVNAATLAAATPKSDPAHETRIENARRIARTLPPLRAIHFSIPSISQCLALGETRYGTVTPSVPAKGD